MVPRRPLGRSPERILPKSCRSRDELDEVIVLRHGKQVIVEPADEWPAGFLAAHGAWTDDIPRPPTRSLGSRQNPLRQL